MKELIWQFEESGINILGYCAPEEDKSEGIISKYKYLGNDDYLLNCKIATNVALCFGYPATRKRVYESLKKNSNLSFPSFVLKDAKVSDSTKLGQGVIISSGAKVSVDGIIDDFAFLNIDALVHHDTRLGKFVTVSPRASLAGNVSVGDGSFVGISATVIQGITIGQDVVVGAGAVVTKDVKDRITVVGVPAREV